MTTIKEYRQASLEAIKQGQKAVREGDFSRADAYRREAVAYEVAAQRQERIDLIRKRGTLYERMVPGHVRRAERTR